MIDFFADRIVQREMEKKQMSESKSWLPRFTAKDFSPFAFTGTFEAYAKMVNKRLAEFEGSCIRHFMRYDSSIDGFKMSSREQATNVFLSVPLKRGVTKADLVTQIREFAGRPRRDSAESLTELADRIERDGIIE